LVKTALSHAALARMLVAPSDMMDGRIGGDSRALDASGFDQTGIMSYAAKFASVFYRAVSRAAESPPQFGDRRRTRWILQMQTSAARSGLDVRKGGTLSMVKPALPVSRHLWRVRERFGKTNRRLSVSGEYAMVKAAAEKGIFDERAAVSRS